MIFLTNVNPNDSDGELIMKWRNDKDTLQNSFNQTIYTWDIFKNIFYNKYFCNTFLPMFACLEGKKIAFVGGMDGDIPKSLEISINIAPEFRGKGLSVIIIKKTIEYISKHYQNKINCIIAEIKESNIPSQRSFTNAGFKFIDKIYKNNDCIHIYRFYIMNKFKINGREIGNATPTYIIAELSCNHNQNIKNAYALIDAAADSGADAVKLQTYTADTMTINSNKPYFTECLNGTLWEGQTLYELYSKAYTPWEWHADLKKYANDKGMDLFSSPFDVTSVDFLESLEMPAYKIASFEITDHVLIKKIAKTGKPVIISSGMASLSELSDAVKILRDNGCTQIAMLKCTSAYPAKLEDANLKTISHMIDTFNVVGGLSDHTLGIEVPIASVILGGSIIEKHFKLENNSGSEDDAFSLTPEEFKLMVRSVRNIEKTVGKIHYSGVSNESKSKKFRRSLFVVENIKKGEKLTEKNIRSIRPSDGMHTKFYEEVLGKEVNRDIEKGTPLNWNLIC